MKTNPQLATEIVKAILDDFTDRRGLRQEWEQIDDSIRSEIVETWLLSTKRLLDDRDTVSAVSKIDLTKPMWLVTGYLPAPDLRRMKICVNALTSSEAVAAAKAQGMDGVSHTRLISTEQIEEWERLAR
jgi:hypothetical protein